MEEVHIMRRALSLAKLGLGKVKTNPMVGCVIVENNVIIGEGYHEEFGKAHAEVNALTKLHSSQLIDAQAFVTLEPCSHFGKTPPCADLLIKSGIKKVCIAMLDPNPLVAGKGMKKMIEAGIDVTVGVLEEEARMLNPIFLHGIKTKEPFITLKWAESKDGFIAGKAGGEKVTGNETDIISHKFRTEVDAICVGSGTIIQDQPKLDTRLVSNDQKLKISFGQQTFEGYINLNPQNIKVGLRELYAQHHIGHILIEGGQKTLQYFIDNELFNQVRIIQSKNTMLNDGIKSPTIDLSPLPLVNQLETKTDSIKIFSKP